MLTGWKINAILIEDRSEGAVQIEVGIHITVLVPRCSAGWSVQHFDMP